MAKQSQIDKRIAELEQDIAVNQHAIAVLRSVQQKKAAKVRKTVAVGKRPDIAEPVGQRG